VGLTLGFTRVAWGWVLVPNGDECASAIPMPQSEGGLAICLARILQTSQSLQWQTLEQGDTVRTNVLK
jgi:hypothetical protein